MTPQVFRSKRLKDFVQRIHSFSDKAENFSFQVISGNSSDLNAVELAGQCDEFE